MTYANMIDSEEFIRFKKQAYSKLYCYLDLLNKADNLKSIPKVLDFQALVLSLINTSDNKLQKLALECLIKSEYKQGILR